MKRRIEVQTLCGTIDGAVYRDEDMDLFDSAREFLYALSANSDVSFDDGNRVWVVVSTQPMGQWDEVRLVRGDEGGAPGFPAHYWRADDDDLPAPELCDGVMDKLFPRATELYVVLR